MIHHLLGHRDGEDWFKENQFFMEQVTHLALQLDAIREGERTLLVSAMLMHSSSITAGAKHDNDALTVIMLGGAGGRLQGGRALDYTGKPDRQLCRLLMPLMHKLDVRPKTFGYAKMMVEEV